MNYGAHYDRLINRARNRVLPGYTERHHVVPRCVGGTDEKQNIVSLTAEEHFVAHQLLIKIYPGTPAISYAVVRMAAKSNNNKIYGWIRRKCAEATSKTKHFLGRKHSPETIAKIVAKIKGRKNTQETKRQMSLSAMGNKRAKGKKYPNRSAAHCAALSAANKGRTKGKPMPYLHTPEMKERALLARRAYWDNWRAKNAELCKRISR